jgi:hypothetical protein
MRYSPFKAHIIQPTITEKVDRNSGSKIESGIDYIAKNSKERNRFTRFNVRLRTDLGMDIVTIPYLKLPFDLYSEIVKDVSLELRNQGREPLILFDLDYGRRGDKFSEALAFFIRDLEVRLIGFYFKSFTKHAVSYDVL